MNLRGKEIIGSWQLRMDFPWKPAGLPVMDFWSSFLESTKRVMNTTNMEAQCSTYNFVCYQNHRASIYFAGSQLIKLLNTCASLRNLYITFWAVCDTAEPAGHHANFNFLVQLQLGSSIRVTRPVRLTVTFQESSILAPARPMCCAVACN